MFSIFLFAQKLFRLLIKYGHIHRDGGRGIGRSLTRITFPIIFQYWYSQFGLLLASVVLTMATVLLIWRLANGGSHCIVNPLNRGWPGERWWHRIGLFGVGPANFGCGSNWFHLLWSWMRVCVSVNWPARPPVRGLTRKTTYNTSNQIRANY